MSFGVLKICVQKRIDFNMTHETERKPTDDLSMQQYNEHL